MSRGEGARASITNPRGSERSSLRSSFRDTGAVRPTTLSEAAKVHRAADTVREKAERHYETHRESWVARHYTRLLLKSGPTLTLSPPGMTTDPKAALMRRAHNEVAQGHAKRLQRIETAKHNLLNTGQMRLNRTIDWGGKAIAPVNAGQQVTPERKALPSPSATAGRGEIAPGVSLIQSVRRSFDLGR